MYCVLSFSTLFPKARKRLIVERNGWKSGSQGCMMYAYGALLTLNTSRPFRGHSVHFSQTWLITRKQLIVESNGYKFEPRGVHLTCILLFLTLNVPRSCDGHSVLFFPKSGHNLKKKGSQWSETDDNLGLRVYVTCLRLIVERNGWKSGSQGCIMYAYGVLFTLNTSRPFGGHSVHFSQTWLITRKQLIVESNGYKFEPRGVHLTCILLFLTLNVPRSCDGHSVLFFPKSGHNLKKKGFAMEWNGW